MKQLLILILNLSLIACSHSNHTSSNEATRFILTNINIVDVVNQRIVTNKALIVSEGKIESIVAPSSITNKDTITIIDGKNGFVTPGLIDMHVHMYEQAAYQFALSHGVTHVRIMNGVPAQLKWRDQVNRGLLIGSSASVSSPILSGYENTYLHHTVNTEQQANAAVEKYHQQGYDLIKVYGNVNKNVLLAILEKAKELNLPVAKHGPHANGDMPINTLTGFQSFEHVEDIYQGPLDYQFDLNRLPEIIAQLKETKVPVTPTLNIFYQLTQLSHEKESFLTKTTPLYTSDIVALEAKHNEVKRWLNASDNLAKHNKKTLEFLFAITKKLHQSGVKLLVGSDSGVLLSPHGIATHTEMSLLQQAGLSNFDVLAAATINPASALNLDTLLGQISPGFQADFIYTTGNPIINMSYLKNPDAVVKMGVWYSQGQLEKLRQTAIENRSLWAEIKTLFEAMTQ